MRARRQKGELAYVTYGAALQQHCLGSALAHSEYERNYLVVAAQQVRTILTVKVA